MMKCVILLVCLIHYGYSHTYHTGECPAVTSMPEFDMKRFLGIWYAIQKTSTASSCLVYNVTRGEEPGEYFIEQISQHFALGLTPLKHEYSYTGTLSVPNQELPGKLRVKFPLNPAGDADFIVFMTDYETFAGIFTCQKLAFAHRQSATLLSRNKDLDRMFVDKMRTRLGSFNVDPFDLSIINQTGCPKDGAEGYNIHIDPNTFSTASIANAVRQAGSKIGDGVEWTLEAGKKLYDEVTRDDNTTDTEVGDNLPVPEREKSRMGFRQNVDENAEWVRF